jgi:hypothetical protein
MFRRIPTAALLGLGALECFAVSGTLAPAQQFSADIVQGDAGSATLRITGKLNVSNGKVRIETSDVPAGFFIVRGDADAAYFVRPAQRTFMDARQSSQLIQVFVAVDPDDPCPQWQAMAKIAGAADHGAKWQCERIGPDVLDGRSTIKYRRISPQNQSYLSWIDPRLNFPVRVQIEGGAVFDLMNISEAPQPEGLFEVPVGHRKFDPQQLIERIKQSDVWVEPTE